MFKTRITELLGIEYPIIAGPMAYLSSPELVSAVSNAGGMGIIASLSYTELDHFHTPANCPSGQLRRLFPDDT